MSEAQILEFRPQIELIGQGAELAHPSTVEEFLSFSKERQFEILKAMKDWLDTFGGDPEQRHSHALRRFSYINKRRILDDFLDLIGSDEVVEAYEFTPTGPIQKWRNLVFMSMCSYDIISMMTKSMDELFDRDINVRAYIEADIVRAVTSKQTVKCSIPPHVLIEKSGKGLKFMIQNRYASPLFDENNEVCGFVCSLKARPLGVGLS